MPLPRLHRIPVRLTSGSRGFLLPLVLALLAAWLLVLWPPAQAAPPDTPPPRGAYLSVHADAPAIDSLRLQSTRVDVRIAGVIAEVTVVQHYQHDGPQPVAASLVFAGSEQAAVHALTVQVGPKVQVARIAPKSPARNGAASVSRAVLQQASQRAGVFQMPVPVIQPGDPVQMTLHYTELLLPSAGRYQFVFPAPLAPRPAGGPGPGGDAANAAFDLHVHLGAPLPVVAIASPSHRVEVSGEDSLQADVTLADNGPPEARDFILDYRLGGEQTATGWMLAPVGDETFFLALVAPPATVAPVQVNPREIVCVVDVSDSMQGDALKAARVVLGELIGSLRPGDRFNVMLFSGSSGKLSDSSVPATRANLDRALQLVARADLGVGTELGPLLRRIAASPKRAEVARSVIVITDGNIEMDGGVLRRVRQNLGHASVFVVGIGAAMNRPVIDGLARAGLAEPFIVSRPELAAAQAQRLRHMIEAPVLTQLRARLVGLDGVDVEPLALPDLLAGRPVWMVGKWRAAPGALHALLLLEGRSADGEHREVLPAPPPDERAGALRFLWARQRIQQLADQETLDGGHAQREAMTALGLSYSVATPYTRFLPQEEAVVHRAAVLPQPVADRPRQSAAASHPRGGLMLALALAVSLGLLGWGLLRFNPLRRVA